MRFRVHPSGLGLRQVLLSCLSFQTLCLRGGGKRLGRLGVSDSGEGCLVGATVGAWRVPSLGVVRGCNFLFSDMTPFSCRTARTCAKRKPY